MTTIQTTDNTYTIDGTLITDEKYGTTTDLSDIIKIYGDQQFAFRLGYKNPFVIPNFVGTGCWAEFRSPKTPARYFSIPIEEFVDLANTAMGFDDEL